MTYIKNKNKINRTAGEVRFIKDKGSDSDEWAWAEYSPTDREMDKGHKLNTKCKKSLAQVLRSSLFALGHAMSAYSRFAKIKSRDISPDGRLGGKGYIMEIKGMRKQYMNIVESLSSLSDTIYDEINADHWGMAKEKIIEQYIQDAQNVMEDPEAWAEDIEEKDDLTRDFHSQRSKTASDIRIANVVNRFMEKQ